MVPTDVGERIARLDAQMEGVAKRLDAQDTRMGDMDEDMQVLTQWTQRHDAKDSQRAETQREMHAENKNKMDRLTLLVSAIGIVLAALEVAHIYMTKH